jgi:hypothetical protein
MEKHYGNYLGIVVNSNDPESRNRLQIWIPNLSNTLYSNWNDISVNKILDYSFDDKDEVFVRLKNNLPWAECASPLIGGGTAMNINPSVNNQPTGSTYEDPVEPNQKIDFDTTLPDMNFIEGELPIDSNDSGGDISLINPSVSPIADKSGKVNGKNLDEIFSPESATVVPTDFDSNGNNSEISTPNVSSTSTSWQESTPESQQILNNLTIKKSGDINVKLGDLNLSENLDNLQNTGIQAFTGGYNDVETVFFAALIQNLYKDSVNRVTGVNDQYHFDRDKNKTKKSNHTIGTKFDITFNSNISLKSGGNMTRNTATKYGLVEGQDYKIIDYLHGTGPHVDVELFDSGRDKLSKIRTGNSEKIATAISGNKLNNSVSESNMVTPSLLPVAANGSSSPYGQAKGVISSPSIGAKVWVFFYGGDIQKPVYFASAIASDEYGQALGRA